jgi:hypothetical protein
MRHLRMDSLLLQMPMIDIIQWHRSRILRRRSGLPISFVGTSRTSRVNRQGRIPYEFDSIHPYVDIAYSSDLTSELTVN